MSYDRNNYKSNIEAKNQLRDDVRNKISQLSEDIKKNDEKALIELRQYLKQFANFYDYSANNVFLVQFQAMLRGKQISMLQSFQDWTKLKNDQDENVKINKGSKGYTILVPIYAKIYERNEKGEFLLDRNNERITQKDENGNDKKQLRFTYGNVFDVADTNAYEIGAIKKAEMHLSIKKDDFKISEDFLKSLIERISNSYNIPIRQEKINSESSGYNRKTQQYEEIVIDERLPSAKKLSVLFHELGHHMMHEWGNQKSTEQKEAEAETFSYVISSKFGVENNSALYLKSYIEDDKQLMGLLTTVQQAVQNLYRHINIDKILQEEIYKNQILDNSTKDTKDYLSNKTSYEKPIPDDKVKELFLKTNDELHATDPIAALNDLGIHYSIKNNGTQYQIKLRTEERTASAYLYIAKDGKWRMYDFGSGESGTIENVIMAYTNYNYKEARNYAISILNVTDYFEEELANIKAINYKPKEHIISEDTRIIIDNKIKENQAKANACNSNTKIMAIEPINNDDKKFIEYLNNRGLYKIPPFMFKATGRIFGKTNESKTYQFDNIGLAVATDQDIKNLKQEHFGIDLHYLQPIKLKNGDTIKSSTFGANGIATFIDGTGEKLIVAESKWDMASAYEQELLKDSTCIIANSTSNYKLVEDFIKNKDFTHVLILNQNDSAGLKFATNILESESLKISGKKFFITYQDNEVGKDPNDLLQNKVLLKNRFQEYFRNINIENNEDIKKFDTSSNALEQIKAEMSDIKNTNTSKRLKNE